MRDRKKMIILGVATLSGVVLAVIALIVINALLLRIPLRVESSPPQTAKANKPEQVSAVTEPDYKSILERNLFRAKLQMDVPKPKSEKEVEEESLTSIVKTMALRGVMTGRQKKDYYVVIDRGGQKGVWTYEVGEVVEKGLVVSEIKKDSVRLEKDDFSAVLKLFSPTFERTAGTRTASLTRTQEPAKDKPAQKAAKAADFGKEVKREGSVTLISKNLAEQLKGNSNAFLSSVAIKAAGDGFQIVAVDKGSLAQHMGIAPNDTLQEVNGYRLSSSGDMRKVYESLKNSKKFEVKVLRGGKQETLRYEIR